MVIIEKQVLKEFIVEGKETECINQTTIFLTKQNAYVQHELLTIV